MRTMVMAAAAAVTFAAGASAAAAQRAEDAFGVWRHPDNGSLVKIFPCGSRLCARILQINDGQKTDNHNPNPAKRDRPIVGMIIMSAKKAGPSKWAGSLYDRSDGKTYSGTITVSSRSTLSLSGCSMGVFCKSTTWTRTAD